MPAEAPAVRRSSRRPRRWLPGWQRHSYRHLSGLRSKHGQIAADMADSRQLTPIATRCPPYVHVSARSASCAARSWIMPSGWKCTIAEGTFAARAHSALDIGSHARVGFACPQSEVSVVASPEPEGRWLRWRFRWPNRTPRSEVRHPI